MEFRPYLGLASAHNLLFSYPYFNKRPLGSVVAAMRNAAACRTLWAFVAPWLLTLLAAAMRPAAVCRALCALVAPWLLASLAAAMRPAAVCRAFCALVAP